MGVMVEVCAAVMLLASVFLPVFTLTSTTQNMAWGTSEHFEAHKLARAIAERFSSEGSGALLGKAEFAAGVFTLENPHRTDPLLLPLLSQLGQDQERYSSCITLEINVGGVRGLTRLICDVKVEGKKTSDRHARVVMLVHDDL